MLNPLSPRQTFLESCPVLGVRISVLCLVKVNPWRTLRLLGKGSTLIARDRERPP
jgi:hypothetical protein